MSNAVDSRTLDPVSEPLTPVSRQERKMRTRQALLDTALELLADRPFATLSLREVAKGAGLVPTAFYRHFASMDDLGVALVEEATRTLRGMIRSARTDPATYQGMISASVTTLHRFVRANEDHFRFLTRERYAGGALAQAIAAELRLFSGDLAIDLARFPTLREWSTEDLHMLADLIVSAMLTTIVELLEARPGDDAKITGTAEKRLRLVLLGVPHWKTT
ncbi:TetR family transcriptional regulator [Amycolatopsis sp.]|uniref:TetR family transcriptional regulator n=1 Tax=Amycolatopsis sp. TaxID=37632 RepID=UPI002D7E83D1|nr:TetR family transcriptional regulator [Amycolatopsis sp.]HET6708917.1 TetR family transcriptional regulator [Amycolatopsis sp.]